MSFTDERKRDLLLAKLNIATTSHGPSFVPKKRLLINMLIVFLIVKSSTVIKI